MKLVNEELIKKWEQLRLTAYLPTPNDRWTIGWGHTHTTRQGMVITREKAEELFRGDVKWAVDAVNKEVSVGLTQNQFDALVSLVFNIGATQFRNSTLLRKLNAGEYQGAAEQFLVWNKQKGKVLKGLVNRRQEEYEYFLGDTVAEGPSSASVDGPSPLKPLLTSKELLTGSGAALTGAASLFGSMAASAQTILSLGLSVTLVALGLFFIWNRIKARKDGER